eukprot:TRINITY_DN9637_c1_g3_i2.p1 TRINITY_DN9637_c1_g3~~TRINITY_DN9637_c1_g3_i2.p1  ORF type:complete len:118 (-),score=9.53 TRINITY_DN9637_c1_g3_i2:109-462(-)
MSLICPIYNAQFRGPLAISPPVFDTCCPPLSAASIDAEPGHFPINLSIQIQNAIDERLQQMILSSTNPLQYSSAPFSFTIANTIVFKIGIVLQIFYTHESNRLVSGRIFYFSNTNEK